MKRTTKHFKADSLSDAAAALTYYGLLAIFPALLALVSNLGLVGSSATKPLLDHLRDRGPGSALPGLECNFEPERGRAIAARHHPRKSPILRPRSPEVSWSVVHQRAARAGTLSRSVGGQGDGDVMRGEGCQGQGVEHLVEAEPAG
ncbi:YhjD/YihY/BrkB family envelope integrity protein [Streptomyces sp. NPDC006465]|uniref:YhjD/YihY/BrkB family envelope integrity protein n=1 Tax=Streptomyces sp. NPDC006465 TaxID=3157174 RepID=UPI0033B55AEA